jgi:acyl-CoA oxidase
MNSHQKRFYDLMKNIRLNAVCLVDAFDWSDSNLLSTLGVYDGNVYERLYDFARNSKFNQNNFEQNVFEKYLKPFSEKLKIINLNSKL